jgi:hypothetical protein
MTKLRCVPVEPTETQQLAGHRIRVRHLPGTDQSYAGTDEIYSAMLAAAPPPPSDISEALELAKEFIADPDKRAQVKVQLAVSGYPMVADMIDEAISVSRALLRSWGRE